MVGLSAIHHSFLQSMMTCGALSTDDTKKLYNKCVQNDQGSRAAELQDVGDLKGQIYIINKAISIADFTIRPAFSPWEETMYWGFCNTTADEAARLATKLRPQEVELFFAIVDELHDNEGVIPLAHAQNVSTQKTMPVAENARAIQKMNQLQWLRILRKFGEQTTVVLGARALIEVPKIREWARQFTEDRVTGLVEIHNVAGMDVDGMDGREDEDEDERDEDDDEEGEDGTPARRRSRRTIDKFVDNEREGDVEGVRPQSRRRLSRRRE